MTHRLLDLRLVRHPGYLTVLMFWMGARREQAALAQLIAIVEIWKRQPGDSTVERNRA